MPDYDAGFKIVARESGLDLARLAGVEADSWQSITGEVHAAERLADRAFRAKLNDERFIVYMEAYTRWHASAPWSVLAKSGLLSERERLPCHSLIYILLPQSYRAQNGTFRLGFQGQPTQQVWFSEICLWKLVPQPWWETSPGLMALSPLFCQDESEEAVVTHAARAIKMHSADRMREADLLTVLAIFSKLTNPKFDALHVIGREAMKESKFYQEIMEEGEVNARRADVLTVLNARFGKPNAVALKQELEYVQDSTVLSELLDRAVKCRSLEGFRRSLARKRKASIAH
jgi:hypothetical protein